MRRSVLRSSGWGETVTDWLRRGRKGTPSRPTKRHWRYMGPPHGRAWWPFPPRVDGGSFRLTGPVV